eukprot:g30087.t1
MTRSCQDGDVGIGIKAQDSLVVLCPSFCRLWFESCAQDFFAPGTSAAKLTDFGNSDAAEEPCFDGVPAAKMRGKAPRAPWTPPRRKEPSLWRTAVKYW